MFRFPKTSRPSAVALAVAASAVLGACDSGSSSPRMLNAQAVDGYIVGATVFCDEVESGGTAAAGRLSCPRGTVLVRVSGGSDVGFDATATTGGVAFAGELSAPGDLAWVTPLSGLAVAIARDGDGEFDPERFGEAVAAIARTFGQSGLDLAADPTSTMQIVRLNAQLHQVVGSFSIDVEDYAAVNAALADVVDEHDETGEALDLAQGVQRVLERINARLGDTRPALAVSAEVLASRVLAVQEANSRIQQASEPDTVLAAARESEALGAALTIDRDHSAVTIEDSDGGVASFGLDEFESSSRVGGAYQAVVPTDVSVFRWQHFALEPGRDLERKRVSIGFELISTDAGDRRRLAVATDDAHVTMRRGQADRISLGFDRDAVVHATSVAADGTVTEIAISLDEARVFTTANDEVSIDYAALERALEERDLDAVLDGDGNYRATLAIGGLRIDEEEGGVVTTAGQQTVTAGPLAVSGAGLRGYLSIDAE